jgi:uncharacterized membrane protein YgaE (UPF0421/DUF939 family)
MNMDYVTYKKENGNFLIILVIAIGVAVTLIFYMRGLKPKMTSDELELQNITKQSSSDEMDEIENDLENTDLTELDRELESIESELNQSN